MILTAITLEQFKGIREPVRIDLKPITLLFGPNSAGKSTIVHALHYAHEILERGNVDPDRTLHGGQAVELGGFLSLVHGHNKDTEIKLKFELDFRNEELPVYRLEYVTSSSELSNIFFDVEKRIEKAELELVISWSNFLDKPILKLCAVHINGEQLAAITVSEDGRRVQLSKLWTNHPIFWPEGAKENEAEGTMPLGDLYYETTSFIREQYDDGVYLWLDLIEQQSPLPQWGRPLRFANYIWQENADTPSIREFTERVSSLVVGPFELLRNSLKSFLYLGPLREVPQRNYVPVRSPVESRWAHGLAAWDLLITEGDPLVSMLNQWLERDTHFNTGYRMSVKKYKALDLEGPLYHLLNRLSQAGSELADSDMIADYLNQAPERRELSVVDVNNGITLEPQDLGIGISELVPVIVAALHARRGIVAIEQPELHIHPAWQVVLGDLFLSQIQDKGLVFLIETHSEHLVLRIMRRMRETFLGTLPPGSPKAEPNNVAVLYVESDQGRTIVREMPLNDAGELVKAWPGGFFEERLPEVLG